GKLFHPEKREVPIQGTFFSSYMSSLRAVSSYMGPPQAVSSYGSSSRVASNHFRSFNARFMPKRHSLVDQSTLKRSKIDHTRSKEDASLYSSSFFSEIVPNEENVEESKTKGHEIKLNFKESKIEVLYEFLKFQSFNGEFNSAGFYPCFDKKEAKDFKEIGIDNEKILCTALAIEYLEVVMFGQFKDECEMCWEKANKALRKLVNEKEFDDVLKKSRDWILKW
ncbi:15063_t:CDS:2, partial [Acaulospora morrowiae]